MNIAIIGASAGIGLETVKRALERNHKAIAFSRSKIDLDENHNLTEINGNATNKEDLYQVIENADAAVVTLGQGSNTTATTLFSDFASVLVEIHEDRNLDIPIIVVTGFGAGESLNYATPWVKDLMESDLKEVYDDKTKMEEILINSDLNWEIVRPGLLLDGDLTESYQVEDSLHQNFDIGNISRADVADFLIKQAENPTQLRKCVAIFPKKTIA